MKFENYPISAQKMTRGSFSCVDFYVYKGLKFLRKFMSFGIFTSAFQTLVAEKPITYFCPQLEHQKL